MFKRKLAFLAFLLHSFSVSNCNPISCPVLSVSYADPPTGICSSADLSYQTSCSFKCIAGYQLTGSEVRVCQLDKTWSGTPSTCEAISCPVLSVSNADPPTGMCSSADLSYQTSCSFKCRAGYQLKGSDVRVCQLDKTWSGTPSTCEEIRCPKLPSVYYAIVFPSNCDHQSMRFSSVCTFVCPAGFTTDVTAPQTVSRSLTCQLTGEWDAQAPQCHDVERPTISRCPGDIMIEAPQLQVRVNWEGPIFTDNSGIPVKVSSNKLSGDLFDAPGSYEVSYTASDSSGNTNNDCTFRITLKRGSNCTAGWTYYGSSCYYVKDTPTLKQSDARQHCQNLGGDLAIIKSEKQNDFIFSLIQGQNTFTKWGAWIGIQRKADGKFYWIDNTPVDGSYSIWADREPNNAGGSENCVQMYGQDSLRKKWNDFSCDLGSHVTNAPVILCQKPQV